MDMKEIDRQALWEREIVLELEASLCPSPRLRCMCAAVIVWYLAVTRGRGSRINPTLSEKACLGPRAQANEG